MPTIRKIVDEADARSCLAAVRAAGATSVAGLGRMGLTGARSLIAWQNNLGRRRKRRGPAQFV